MHKHFLLIWPQKHKLEVIPWWWFSLLENISSFRQPYWLASDEKHHQQSSPPSRRLLAEAPPASFTGLFCQSKPLRWTTSLSQSLWWWLSVNFIHVSFHPSLSLDPTARSTSGGAVQPITCLSKLCQLCLRLSLPATTVKRSVRETGAKYRPGLSLSGSFESKAAPIMW